MRFKHDTASFFPLQHTAPVWSNPAGKLQFHIFFILPLLFVLFFVVTPSQVFADTKTEKKKLERIIRKKQANAELLREGLEKEKENIAKAALEEKSLLEELETLERKLQKQLERLQDLKAQMAKQKKHIISKEEELREVKAKKKVLQDHLQKRISAYYKLDKVSLINITFDAKTLPEVLNFHDSFETLLTYDQDIITDFRISIAKLNRAREALTLEESILHDFIAQTNQEKRGIETSKQEMETLLSHIRTQASLHEQAVLEIENEAQKLNSSLIALKKKEDKLSQDFLLAKGKLPLPLEGSILTRFNEETVNQLGISKKSQGIAIAAEDGAPVKAIFKGKIMYSGYLRGHGNTIVVDHGHQYFSILSRVEKILVKKGESVKKGKIIAKAGDTATIIDNGVQFEIRHGSKPLDPLKWINPNMLITPIDTL